MSAIRQIVKLGDPILRQDAQTVKRFGIQLHILLDDMAKTMYASNGVGLAAPQIGVSKRVVVIDDHDQSGLIELVNPEITVKEGCELDVEYCLSVPNRGGEVERATKIVVNAQDRFGEEYEYEVEGFLARIFQHEIDHLNGQLFVDIMKREVKD